MTLPDSRTTESLNVEVERTEFRKYAEMNGRFSSQTYKTDGGIDHRTKTIFHTFDQALHGRGSIPEETKGPEKRQLYAVVRRDVVYPLLHSYTQVSGSQAAFDRWHKEVVQTLKARCPVQWNHGPILTVGMVQQIINLHCKSLWTLEVIRDRYPTFFHAAIGGTILEDLLEERGIRWTRLDSYDTYLGYQLRIRQLAREQGTCAIALECWNWSRNR